MHSCPDDWKSYTSTANWYRLWHPQPWQVSESDETVLLSAPDGTTVTLECCRLEADEPIDLESIAALTKRFPASTGVRRIPGLDIADTSIGFEGDEPSRAVTDATGFKRLFSKKASTHWSFWLLRQKRLLLAATCRFSLGHAPEVKSDVLSVLGSLSFAVEPADPPQGFAERVLALAREKFPLLACELNDVLQLKLGESQLNLFNLYRTYVKAPDRFRDIVLPALTTVVQVQEWGTRQTEPPLEQVRERIFPMLYPESVWRENFPNYIGTPWIADLMILYVVDEAQAYWYIRNDLPQRWGLDLDELHALAIENLERHFEETPMEFTMAGEENGPRLLMPNRPDAYNATRILSGSFHRKLRELLGPELAVGLPSRDFFIAVSLNSAETVEDVRRKVVEDYVTMDHPVCEQLLLVSLDGISEYAAPKRG
ncbi:MAG: DUF1444 family protein [Planctomycetaceae bacterium]